MTLHVALTHRTEYSYDRPIRLGPQIVRLRPAPHCRTPIVSYSLKIEPAGHFINWQQDPFGNFLARVVVPEATSRFSVTVGIVADMAAINPFDFFIEDGSARWPFTYDAATGAELTTYLALDEAGPLLTDFVAAIDRQPRTTIDLLCSINQQLRDAVSYLVRLEPGVQSAEETLERKSGSCRDSAWLLVQVARHLGLAARFVSGYLIQLEPDIKSLDGPAGATADFTDLHAWAEIYVPGAGWIGLDPTSGLLTGEGHIPVAATPSPGSAAPVSGGHEPATVGFNYAMHVSRVHETPRVTRPYEEDIWQRILATGNDVDKRLVAGDMRLSMGGEPTFVAVDDLSGAEWNTSAVGPTKRRFADELVRRLRDRFAPGGMLHYGQGKWYPGEQLPRWAYAVYWRNDGQPLWNNQELIAPEIPPVVATIETARDFSRELCRRLGLHPDSFIPAHEDSAHYLLAEHMLPEGQTPLENKLADPAERLRLMRVFDAGFGNPAAFVLPLQSATTRSGSKRWITERWTTRRGKLFLVPGDSAAGLRLPLSALITLPALDYPHVVEADPMTAPSPLPAHETLAEVNAPIDADRPDTGAVRTAMAIEPRDGHLCIFMPPVADGDDYARLLAAIEGAADATGAAIRIDGYTPPHDDRLSVIKVTPDPGVIEVNVHPARSWDELVGITTALYDDARATRLRSEKFMVDGRHGGTGGGNHIVVGGMTPAESPFLRRPDLLASVIAYWQNHPSLSYLFSGLFVGPTSQAPRLDEARHEALYEMEIALAQVPQAGAEEVPPWLVDRLFRHLLIDVTGNTHRAEICIDKLYSPDGPTGRLGLVEFRSFEMPPHARMSVAQQLLIRALLAMFWEKPYRNTLVRWGTALHDRFMLPHFVWADFATVIGDLRTTGLALDLEWFKPHFEFRFPKLGAVEAAGVGIELRYALEPWHVLGEEGVSGGTARFVDSSLERVEARISGLKGDRYVVTCNGRALPLTPTGVTGELAAGIRFRAWQLYSALHPTIAPHVPLVFDIVDTWNGRSIGGCRYHVAHPGGRNFETFPVNALEAEGRRLARFEAGGHTSGPVHVSPLRVNPDYPLTLDLRTPS